MVVDMQYTPQDIFEKLGDCGNEEKFRVENKLLREMFVAAPTNNDARSVTHKTWRIM
jgi:hypothetical protein